MVHIHTLHRLAFVLSIALSRGKYQDNDFLGSLLSGTEREILFWFHSNFISDAALLFVWKLSSVLVLLPHFNLLMNSSRRRKRILEIRRHPPDKTRTWWSLSMHCRVSCLAIWEHSRKPLEIPLGIIICSPISPPTPFRHCNETTLSLSCLQSCLPSCRLLIGFNLLQAPHYAVSCVELPPRNLHTNDTIYQP